VNTARLVFGWLFLAGFTAAGTYYAMDEADQRVGLARFQLHEKLGIVRYAAARPPIRNQIPPNNNQIVPPNNNQVVPPNNNQVVPPNNNQVLPPNNNQVVPPNNNQVTPPNNNQVVPPNNNQVLPPNNNQIVPPNNNQVAPPNNNQIVPPNNNQRPPSNNQGPATPPPSRPADFTDTNIRLDELKGQATRFKSTISRMHTQYGTARLDEPMSNLNRLLRQAQGALNANDTASARRYMDQADREVTKLKELLDQ